MKKLLLVLILLGLPLMGTAYWLRTRRAAKDIPIAYTVAPVEHGTLNEVVSATGLVRPREVFVVGSELPGKVVAVLADFNQVVEEGDVLLRLDDRMARQATRPSGSRRPVGAGGGQTGRSRIATPPTRVKRLRGKRKWCAVRPSWTSPKGKRRAPPRWRWRRHVSRCARPRTPSGRRSWVCG